MSRAKEHPPREDFVCCFLGGGGSPEHGSWSWQWGAAGAVALGGLSPLRTVQLKAAGPQAKASEVALYTNIPSFAPEGMPVGPPPVRPLHADPHCRFSPSLLKSLLQKAVRRGLGDCALPLAAELWARGPIDALRRLLVIIIEDALLHPAFPALTHFMLLGSDSTAPGEHYRLGPLHAAAYLSVVRDICKCPARDPPLSPFPLLAALAPHAAPQAAGPCPWLPPLDAHTPTLTLTPAHLAFLGAGPAALIRALQARALYGGLSGDVQMLKQAAAVWACRFAHDAAKRAQAGCSSGSEAAGAAAAAGTSPPSSSSSAAAPAPGGEAAAEVPAWLLAHAPPPEHKSWASVLASSHGTRLALASFHGPFTLQFLLTPRVRLADAPLAGVDHHVSEIVEDVLRQGGAFGERSEQRSDSLTQAVASACAILVREEGVPSADIAATVCSLMWTLRSSVNWRRGLAAAPGEEAGPSPAARRAFALLLPHFDAFSQRLLASRLG